MTSKEYQRAIDQLGLTQVDAAKFFGVSDRQSRYWAAEKKPSRMVEIILRIMLAKNMSVEDVESIVRTKISSKS